MAQATIRSAFSSWPRYNALLREAVRDLTDQQLAFQPSVERWPLWASIGHTACQRVSLICGLAGEPGAESTPFPNALYNCPGDEDLENVLHATELVRALDSTFLIVEQCLDRWTFDTLEDEIQRTFDSEKWFGTRGSVIQRAFAHDISHIAEVNEIFGLAGLTKIELWDQGP